ncbi:MAG: glycosyltransferase family 4 protein [Candidatus Omnitrophota bacterium]
MNILFITTHFNYGGITSYILSLAKGLKKNGHNVYVASSGGDCQDNLKEIGVTHITIPIKTKNELNPKVFLSFLKLKKIVKEKNIDIIHAHTRVTQVLAEFIFKFTRIPYVVTCHGFFRPSFHRLRFGCWGKKTIAISQQVKDHLINDFKLPLDKIILIHNGIDLERFSLQTDTTQAKQEFGLKKDVVIGLIARLSQVKGQDILIVAVQKVIARFPYVQLLLVGEGKTKKDLIKLSKNLNLEKNIIFMPSVSDTNKVLAAIDIFVLPSIQEGLGLALMEAMAKGIAVVGSRVGGIITLIKDNQNGLLVEPKDIEGLSEAIIKLIEDKTLAKTLGQNARSFIEKEFSLTQTVKKTQEVYADVTEK